ncbi:hypothetical protein LCC91_07980 [Tepidimonas taiwanensis]|uniref:Uncharacterized protein n=1 Tax=Tepidimonas taiwanensis TaxID=307486 RepID=A0A554XAU9_9BURK|nr:ABC-three component system middle component 6 [Tepidimonas taiwanensis]MCX7693191.1 hypothetical protein [Tepidimonas taiwanensis]TSE32954.1 hypothetical protein Ttaiw_00814 [Tepidimonas taiwanensis]UBQ04513.1 hypothetical protein LCC91_07980 [Tepidimonas taiwanensis]
MHNLALAVAPHEHLGFADSLIGLAGWLRTRLDAPRTLDELYAMLSQEESGWPRRPSFEQVALAVTLLFAIGVARFAHEDRIERVKS